MSYQVLARKWRPRDFESTIGQDHVVRALSHALAGQRLHHAYLFTGTRGVGKTTLARIMAKALNCVGPDGQGGITPTPCNQCEACTAIDAGRFIDYIEMDAASNRGVDEMTQLLERAAYAPSSARFKVYMIDEVHMLTAHAFNAMLKTLEEPPDYVKFILATTDPQKIPVTVLSRCLQFNLKPMAPAAIAGQLARVLGAESIAAEQAALQMIARAARGSMRDALSLLDQAIAYGAGRVTLEGVRAMMGAIDASTLLQLLRLLAEGDVAAMLALADEMAEHNLSFAQALRDLASLLHRIALAQQLGDERPRSLDPSGAAGASGAPDGASAVVDDTEAGVQELARRFAAEEVQLYYQIALHGRDDLHLAPDEYAGFTMSLIRMAAFRPEAEADRTPARPAAALQGARPSRASMPAPPRTEPRAAPARERPAPPVAAVIAEAAAAAPPREFDGDWPALVARLSLGGLPGQLAARSELVAYDQGHFHLRVPIRSLLDSGATQRLQAALRQVLGAAVRVSAELGTPQTATAADRAQEARDQRQQRAVDAIYADPFVRELMDSFGAEVEPGSIRPTAEGANGNAGNAGNAGGASGASPDPMAPRTNR